jgi:hypothetical protein
MVLAPFLLNAEKHSSPVFLRKKNHLVVEVDLILLIVLFRSPGRILGTRAMHGLYYLDEVMKLLLRPRSLHVKNSCCYGLWLSISF